jgi:hypothetical protein
VSKEHSDVVVALVTAAAGTTYDAIVPPDAAYPYRVVFTDDGLDEATSIEGNPDHLTVRFVITASGLSRESVQGCRDQGHDAVAGEVPTVSGRSCSVIRHVNSRPIEMDYDVTPHLLYSVNEYEFFSVPA